MRGILLAAALAVLAAWAPAARGGAAGRQDFPLAWSPDGRVIVFDRGSINGCDVHGIQPDGRGLQALPGCGTGYAWSRDGRLAFARGSLGRPTAAPGGIFIATSRGTPRRLTTPAGVFDSEPQWSPDGAWISFARTRYRRINARSSRQIATNIWIVKPDGTDLHRIASHPGSDWSASWAPDGRHIVFVRQSRRLRGDLFVADVDSGRVRRLTYGSDNG